MERQKIINTIGELISYLEQFDKSKPLNAGYINIIGNQIIDIKKRPLLDDFIEERSSDYHIKPLFY